jgi:hypothetical protein
LGDLCDSYTHSYYGSLNTTQVKKNIYT